MCARLQTTTLRPGICKYLCECSLTHQGDYLMFGKGIISRRKDVELNYHEETIRKNSGSYALRFTNWTAFPSLTAGTSLCLLPSSCALHKWSSTSSSRPPPPYMFARPMPVWCNARMTHYPMDAPVCHHAVSCQAYSHEARCSAPWAASGLTDLHMLLHSACCQLRSPPNCHM